MFMLICCAFRWCILTWVVGGGSRCLSVVALPFQVFKARRRVMGYITTGEHIICSGMSVFELMCGFVFSHMLVESRSGGIT